MKIRTRIIAATLAVMAAVCVAFFVYVLERQRTDAYEALEGRIQRTEERMRLALPGPLYDGNLEQLNAYLDSVFRSPDLVELALTEARGDIRLQRTCPRPGLGRLIERSVAIERRGDILGEVRLVYTSANIEEQLTEARNELLLFAAALMLAVAAVIYGMARGLTRPLERLTEAARAMAAGKLDRPVAAAGAEELVVLGESFERMRDAIRTQLTDLAEKNRQLNAEIVQRRATEQERDRLASVLEATPDFVGMADPQARILFLNRAGRQMTGVGDKDLTHAPIATLHPDWANTVILQQGIPAAIRDGVWSGETAVLGADGREIPVSQVILSHRDAEGRLQYLSTIIRDLTERKRAEAHICELNAQLEQRVRERTAQLAAANQELEAFAYSVSHDLRAPLRGIDGFSQALLEDYGERLDDTGRDYLNRVRRGVQRMSELIDDLLKLSRISRANLRYETVDLSALAQDILGQLRQAEPQRRVETVIAPGLMAQGDPGLLRAALENLLGNAWKYTSKTPEARIELGAREQAGETVYFVRDNGVGFDMAHTGKLFGPFQRLHHRDEFEGTGIGLATVQRVIHRHGGRIWAEGTPGRGAGFYFTLGQPE